MLRRRFLFPVVAGALAFVACQDSAVAPDDVDAPELRKAAGQSAGEAIQALMDDMNVALADQGADYRVAMAEYITSGDGDEGGNTIIACLRLAASRRLRPTPPSRDPWRRGTG